MIAFYFNKNKIFKGTRIVVREVEDVDTISQTSLSNIMWSMVIACVFCIFNLLNRVAVLTQFFP
jgi:hypothetical protein